MTKSMTGYGKAECIIAGKNITIEIRSLNSKSLDINLKLTQLYREKETLIRNELIKVVQRGKVDFSIQVDAEESPASHINKTLFKNYYEELSAIAETLNIPVENEPVLAAILRLPDIITTMPATLTEDEWKVFFACLREALLAFDQFRIAEGEVLSKDITDRVHLIENLLKDIQPFEKQRMETIRQRIENGLKELNNLIAYDRNRFEQEMIYYLEKLDITEEKIRLRQHCAHFIDTMSKEEGAGRKLGFIVQEMGREINTLGSKANQADIQQTVVRMKDELEKIKEQLLNVL